MVTPNPAVVGQGEEITAYFFTSEDETERYTGSVSVVLLDERRRVLYEGTTATGAIAIPLAGLAAARYIVHATSVNKEWEVPVMLVAPGKVITASPNPARQGVDDSVTVVVASPNTERYGFAMATFSGQTLWQTESSVPEARLPLAGINPGTYQITVTDGEHTWTEDLDYLVQDGPYLTVSPNPAGGLVTATIQDPLYPSFTLGWQLADGLTGDELASGTDSGPSFRFDVGQISSGNHILVVRDGYQTYSKHILVSH